MIYDVSGRPANVKRANSNGEFRPNRRQLKVVGTCRNVTEPRFLRGDIVALSKRAVTCKKPKKLVNMVNTLFNRHPLLKDEIGFSVDEKLEIAGYLLANQHTPPGTKQYLQVRIAETIEILESVRSDRQKYEDAQKRVKTKTPQLKQRRAVRWSGGKGLVR